MKLQDLSSNEIDEDLIKHTKEFFELSELNFFDFSFSDFLINIQKTEKLKACILIDK